MHGLMATSMGTLVETANAHRDLLSPYLAEILDKIGPLGPQQAADVEALVGRWHRQVQERVFGKGYRILLMPTMATPSSAPTCSKPTPTGRIMGSRRFKYALTWPWNLLNRYPVLDVPLGQARPGCPRACRSSGRPSPISTPSSSRPTGRTCNRLCSPATASRLSPDMLIRSGTYEFALALLCAASSHRLVS